MVSKYWPLSYYDEEGSDGSSSVYFRNKYQIVSGILELTQSFDAKSDYLTIDKFKSYGKNFAKAINQYYHNP